MRLEVLGKGAFVHDGGVRFDSSKPVAVLLHGAGSDHTLWSHQSRYLAHRGLAVLVPDLPGHGRSDGPAPATIPGFAGWVAALLDELGVGQASLVGHSMGSFVALECAASHPDRVTRVALVSSSAQMRVHPDLQGAADRADPLAIELMVGWSFTGPRRLGGYATPGIWVEGGFRRLLEDALPVSLAGDLRACSEYQPLPKAAQVRCPALVISGSHDVMTPASAGRSLASAIAGSRFEIIEGAGHSVVFADPDLFRRHLEAFLIP